MSVISIKLEVDDKGTAKLIRFKEEIAGIKPPSSATAQGFTSIKDRVLEVTGVMQKMARILVSVQVIMATVVTALGIRKIIEAADAWTMMSSRLSLVENSTQGVIAVQERLFKLAQDVRLPLQDVVQLYSRLAFNAQQLGLNQDHLIAITKAVSQAMQISGSTAQESAAGVMQLTQALASNNLQGDELRSLLESQPRLLKAFADGLNIVSPEFKKLTDSGMAATGAIRAMAKAGKLDAGLILQALVTQTQALDSEFGKLSRTVGQSWTQVMNQLQQGLKGINTEPLTQALDRVRAWFADSSTQSSIKSFADGVMKALGALAESVPKIVGFVQGHLDSLSTVFQAILPFIGPIVTELGRMAKLYANLPPVVQEVGVIMAVLLGAKGFALFIATLSLMDRLNNSWQALKQGMPLSQLQGSGSADVERFLKEQQEALLKFRGQNGMGGLPAPSQQDIDAYMKLYDAAKKPLEPIKATPKALDDVKKKVHETAGEIAELEATAKRMATGLTLDGTAASTFTAEMTPLNVRLADANTLFQDVRVSTAEYSTALIGLSVSLSDVEAQTEGYTMSAGELQRSLAQTEPVLMSFEDRMKGQISLFPKTRVQADAYLSTLGSVKTTTVDLTKSSSLLDTSLNHLFSGISDILSIFGVKLGKFLLLLQNLPRAIGGLREVFAGLGGLMTLGGTALGAGTAWADTAQAVTALGNASGETAGVLGFLSGTISVVIRTLMLFGNGLMGVLGFFSQIVQGIASGGGIINTITSAFSGLVSSGGALYGVFNGLSNVGSALFSVFTEGTSLANIFQGAFDALGLTSGGFSSGVAASGGQIGVTGAAGEFATFLGEWVPIVGALYMAAQAIQNFFSGGTAVKIGTSIGLVLAGPFGAWAGGIIGGLFGPTPKAKFSAGIAPFDRNSIGSAVDTTVPGTQVGAGIVNVGGNIMSNKKERKLQEAIAAMINDLLIRVVDATVLMIKTLPPSIGAQLDQALTDLEATGLEIVDKKWKGGSAGKKLKKRIKGLMDETLQDLVTALDFGDVDLKALGYDPNDPKGKKGGEVARGFEAMMMALGGLSAIVKEVGPAIDLSGVSLAQFTQGAIDLFKGFAKEGETFKETITRVMQAFGEIIALKDQIHTALQGLTGDLSEVVTIIKTRMADIETNIVSLVDALTVAIESGGTPEEVLAAAKAATEAVVEGLRMQIEAVTSLRDAVLKLNSAITGGVDLIIDLTQQINTLRNQDLGAMDFQSGLDGIVALFNQLTDVTSRIALFSSGLRFMAGNLTMFTENIPLVVQGFNIIMDQIREMTNPQQAVAALQQLAGAVNTGLQALVAGVQRQTQARIAGLEAEKSAIRDNFTAQRDAIEEQKDLVARNFDAQRRALDGQRDLITESYNAQRDALQTQLDLAQQWSNVLQSVEDQLVDLFNLLAPTHPLTSLNEVQAQFNAAFADFQASPSADAATKVQDLARQLLQLAQQTPGYDLPSAAFQGLAASVQTALEAIQAFASAQPSQEAIQAQMAAIEAEQASSLANIDAQIAALSTEEAAALAAIDAQIAALNVQESAALASIDQQIASANAAGQAQIQQFQELAAQGLEAIRAQLVIEMADLAAKQAEAAAALQAVLGDKTYEQFIAEKQAEAANLLRGIDETLKHYLKGIVDGLGFDVPAMASGGYVPARPGGTLVRLAEGGQGEFVIPERSATRTSTSETKIIFSPNITVHADSSTNGRRVAEDVERALLEAVRRGPFRKEVQDAAKGR